MKQRIHPPKRSTSRVLKDYHHSCCHPFIDNTTSILCQSSLLPCHAPCLLHSQTQPWSIGSYASLVDSQESLLVHPGSGDRYDVHDVVADIWQAEVPTDSFVEKVSCVDAASDAVPNDEAPEFFQQLDALPLGVEVPTAQPGYGCDRSKSHVRADPVFPRSRVVLLNAGE